MTITKKLKTITATTLAMGALGTSVITTSNSTYASTLTNREAQREFYFETDAFKTFDDANAFMEAHNNSQGFFPGGGRAHTLPANMEDLQNGGYRIAGYAGYASNDDSAELTAERRMKRHFHMQGMLAKANEAARKSWGAKPAETKPAETKPAETKPVETETKPVETKLVETKPAETKLVETKLVETKPAETKLVETKLATPAEQKTTTSKRPKVSNEESSSQRNVTPKKEKTLPKTGSQSVSALVGAFLMVMALFAYGFKVKD